MIFGTHITGRLWSLAVEIAHQLGIKPDAHVLDLGCGDGTFANRVLAREFRAVDGLDFTDAGIKRANAESPRPDVRFDVCDLTRADLKTLPHYDGAFLIAILHHVKKSAPSIISRPARDHPPRRGDGAERQQPDAQADRADPVISNGPARTVSADASLRSCSRRPATDRGVAPPESVSELHPERRAQGARSARTFL
jgi:SAM-dependent methyltransferase